MSGLHEISIGIILEEKHFVFQAQDHKARRLEEMVLKPGSMYVSYEWVTMDLYRAQNPKHMDIIQDIERGNALPGLRSYNNIVEIAKKVRFEVVKEKDLISKTTHEPMMV
nr:24-methylenesterol C-methyltransferase 2 [Tanacetum cinerariifolium]